MNSYAITAAQQANNYYASQMANKIPELRNLAYQMYLDDKESMVQDLGLLQGMDATQYNRYRNTMQDYRDDRNFVYGKYLDDVAQGNWEQNFGYGQFVDDRNFNYGVSQDNQTQSNWETTYNDNKAQQELENSRYDDEIARSEAEKTKADAQTQVYALLELGQMPDSALLQAAGISEAFATAFLKGIKEEQARAAASKSSGSGGGGGGYTGDDDDKLSDDKEYTPTVKPKLDDGSVEGLGLGPVDETTLKTIATAGGLTTDGNGGVYWAEGWDASNYGEKVKEKYPNLATQILMNGLFNL
jgi:hypothetical protein